MLRKKWLYIVLLLLFLGDTAYSFLQHYNKPLDGDMAESIVPAEKVKPLLQSPFGGQALLKGEKYINPNRFFSHWVMYHYFNHVPIWLQKVVTPIDSVYLACAIFKTILQVLLIFLVAACITGTFNVFRFDFMLAVTLVFPLFQTNGYNRYMGIIDASATYTFFYAMPLAFLIIFLLPLLYRFYHQRAIVLSLPLKLLWFFIALLVCFSGPLNTGVLLILALLLFSFSFFKSYIFSVHGNFLHKIAFTLKNLPKELWIFLFPAAILSLYSLYLGRYNYNNIPYSLSDLYLQLPTGIFNLITQKPGFLVLFSILTINIFILKHIKTETSKKILIFLKWFGIFCLIYLLLLPLGGYRHARPAVVRYDTFMPITIGLIFFFGLTTFSLMKQLNRNFKKWYIPLVILVLLIFTNADRPKFDNNDCEKNALREIAASQDTVIRLNDNCTVLSWGKIIKPEDSELNAELLLRWNICKDKKLFFHGK